MANDGMLVAAMAPLLSSDIGILILLAIPLLSLASSLKLWDTLSLLLEFTTTSVPTIDVKLAAAESDDDGVTSKPDTSKKVQLRDPERKGFVQCYDPSTLQHLGEVPAMTKEDVDAICAKAAKAQKSWSRTTYAQRRLVMRTIQKYIVNHVEDICRVCTRDSGKPKVDALLGEVMTTCEKIRTINANGEEWLRRQYRPSGPMMMHKTAYVEYVPFGVLGVIAPWNYPFHNMLNHIISGLFSGNAVVSKCSEHTSWSSDYFGRIVKAALVECGHDPDIVQTVTGFGEAGSALVSSSYVDKIIFTGSPGVGRLVMEGCSKNLKPVILELGGKDPMVFCDDVKIKDVVPWAMRGCFQNCGQNCCGVERLFVYESIVTEFIDTVLPRVKGLRQGVPLKTCGSDGDVDCGAMVMDAQMDHIQALVDDAVSKGATLHCGGKRNDKLDGQFYVPTLLSGVTADMKISTEEVFGPIMCIVTVPNDDDEKCVEMINACSFGLGSSVYSASQKRGMKIGKQLRSGMFTVNDFGVNYLIQSLPFGGVGESGFDRFAGPEGLRACCLERSIVEDRIPGVRTTIPSPIDYPIDIRKGLPFGTSLVNLFYNESLLGKIKAIFGLIKYG
uniref:Aldehyde dehydrogenase domain-containing protein n=1 Tax=Ditylum brightwellii TaxID=49249 RepID=A0A6S8YE02_9STRA|mmetsp:Transcript_15316/g.22723  ORF Transcript_15316/g.22723 Transcript_15316/m.22723 type:complete len:614 (+) Transcript_15316:208-2049(+)